MNTTLLLRRIDLRTGVTFANWDFWFIIGSSPMLKWEFAKLQIPRNSSDLELKCANYSNLFATVLILSGILKTKYLWKIITLQECKIKFDYENMVLWVCSAHCAHCAYWEDQMLSDIWQHVLYGSISCENKVLLIGLMYMIWKSKDIL